VGEPEQRWVTPTFFARSPGKQMGDPIYFDVCYALARRVVIKNTG